MALRDAVASIKRDSRWHLSGDDALIAPELLHYEVGNVLATKTRLNVHEAAELFGYFLDLRIETYSLGADEYRASLDLAGKYKITVYDASYVALALALNAKLATADKKLATRIAGMNYPAASSGVSKS